MKALPGQLDHIGYRDKYSDNASIVKTASPNVNGFLLEAIMQTAVKQSSNPTEAKALSEPLDLLMNGMWKSMTVRNENYTGATWENIGFDGRVPDTHMSLSHPWSSAPSYILPEYILGLRASTPGWMTWSLRPFVHGAPEWVSGKRKTPAGVIFAPWRNRSGGLEIAIDAPEGTTGSVEYGGYTVKAYGGRKE